MLVRQALAAVLAREADPGQVGVEQHALDLTVPADRGELCLVVIAVALPSQFLRTDLAQIAPDEGPGPLPEVLEALHLLRRLHSQRAHAAAPSRASTKAAIRCRWSAGVPARARLTVTRRRNRCRACS